MARIEGELDIAAIEAQIVPVLTGLNDDVSSTTAWSAIERTFDSYVSEPAIRLRDYVKFSLLNGQDIGTDLQALILSFIDKNSDDVENAVFKPSTVGDYTDTCGWSLLALDVWTNLTNFIANLKINFTGTFSSIVDAWDKIALLNARANMYMSKMVTYWFSSWGQDEYVTSTQSAASSTDFSFSNGFVDLGRVGFSSDDIQNFRKYGLTQSTALCLHTLGATWYVFFSNEIDVHLGFCRHLYPEATAQYLYNGLANEGNTWEDVESRLDGADFSPIKAEGGVFGSVQTYNNYVTRSIEATSRLIPAGLIALADEQIQNVYYQDQDSTIRANTVNMFVKGINFDHEVSRTECLDAALYAGSSTATTFALRHISLYFSHLVSGVAHSPYAHTIETAQSPGKYRLMDDAMTKQTRITSLANVGKGIVAAAAVVLIAVASAKLKKLAYTTYVNAQRALYDTNYTPSQVRKMTRKANILAKLSGMTTDVATYTVNDGVSKFTNAVTKNQQGLATNIGNVGQLVTDSQDSLSIAIENVGQLVTGSQESLTASIEQVGRSITG